MARTVQDILDSIERIAPKKLAEEWDNVGLMIGNPDARVTSVLVGLDPTLALLEEARSCGADLLVTHHPFIFHPLKSVHLGKPEGSFVEQAIMNRISVVSCHTNLDSTAGGVSYSLAGKLGLEEIRPLIAHHEDEQCGMGCIGRYDGKAVSPEEFLVKLREACDPPWLLATGNRPERIQHVAVCGGSGSDVAPVALEKGAQVFVTSEVKHSMARWAEETGLWLIDAGHFATENQALEWFAGRLGAEASLQESGVAIRISQQQASPLKLV